MEVAKYLVGFQLHHHYWTLQSWMMSTDMKMKDLQEGFEFESLQDLQQLPMFSSNVSSRVPSFKSIK